MLCFMNFSYSMCSLHQLFTSTIFIYYIQLFIVYCMIILIVIMLKLFIQNSLYRMSFSYSTFQQTKTKLINQYNNSPQCIWTYGVDQHQHQHYKDLNDNIILQKVKKKNDLDKLKHRLKLIQQALNHSSQTEQNNKFVVNCLESIFLTENPQNAHNPIQTHRIRTHGNELNIQIFQTQQMSINNQITTKQKLEKQTISLIEQKNKCKIAIEQIKRIIGSREYKPDEAEQICNQNKNHQIVLRTHVKKIKRQLSNTTRFFKKNLQGRSLNRIRNQKQNQSNLDELTTKIIKFSKLKLQLQQQQLLLKQLDQQYLSIHSKISAYNRIYHQFSQIISINKFVKQINSTAQRPQIIIETYKKNLPNIILNEQMSINQITQQIIECYRNLDAQNKRLKNLYFMSLTEVQDLKKEFTQIDQVEIIAKAQKNTLMQQFIEKDKIIQSQVKQNVFQQKVEQLGISILEFYDRLVFCLKRQINSLKRITLNWLKFDKSCLDMIKQLDFEMSPIFQINTQYVSQSQSKDSLAQHFQKWEKYLFYIQVIHKNPFIYRYLNKKILVSNLKKIIKTKIKYPQVCTQQLFVYSLSQLEDQSLKQYIKKIRQIFELIVKINNHVSTFKFLIVNQIEPDIENQDLQNEDKQNQCNVIKLLQQEVAQIKVQQKKMQFQQNFRIVKQNHHFKDTFSLHQFMQSQFNKVTKII